MLIKKKDDVNAAINVQFEVKVRFGTQKVQFFCLGKRKELKHLEKAFIKCTCKI